MWPRRWDIGREQKLNPYLEYEMMKTTLSVPRNAISITYQSNNEDSMKITTKGQVTIPQTIREQFGLLPNTEVEFRIEGDRVILTKARKQGRGQEIVEHLRRFKGLCTMSTDEVMNMTRDYDTRGDV